MADLQTLRTLRERVEKATGADRAAEQIARETLLDALPEGVPPYFVEIAATTRGSGRTKQIVAELRMIDGLPATVVFSRWALGWSHRFVSMPGGALSWENGRWMRIDEDDALISIAESRESEQGEKADG